MTAVDTNILVYAHTDTAKKHDAARLALTGLAEGSAPWGIPAPCLGEFLRVLTHKAILADPYPMAEALAAAAAFLASPSVRILAPGEQYWSYLSEAATDADARGNLIFDAGIVAICREAGVTELLTEDRDFRRFSGFQARELPHSA